MASDFEEAFAKALAKLAGRQATSFARNWAVPTILPMARTGSANAEAGETYSGLVYHQAAVAYNGTNTYLPFTANVSMIEGSGLSDDMVIG